MARSGSSPARETKLVDTASEREERSVCVCVCVVCCVVCFVCVWCCVVCFVCVWCCHVVCAFCVCVCVVCTRYDTRPDKSHPLDTRTCSQ